MPVERSFGRVLATLAVHEHSNGRVHTLGFGCRGRSALQCRVQVAVLDQAGYFLRHIARECFCALAGLLAASVHSIETDGRQWRYVLYGQLALCACTPRLA